MKIVFEKKVGWCTVIKARDFFYMYKISDSIDCTQIHFLKIGGEALKKLRLHIWIENSCKVYAGENAVSFFYTVGNLDCKR